MMRMQVTNSVLPLLMGTQLGFAETDIGLQFGIMGLVSVLMIAPAGYLSDHWGRKWACTPAAALSAVLFFGYGFAADLLSLSLLSVVSGVANGLALGAMTTYTYDIVPSSTRAQFQSFRRAAGESGALLGPAMGGLLATVATPAMAMLAFVPIHLASALLLAFLARESLRRPATVTA
jgi:MFS family permease